jgi:CheY-like chemotaxis protein
MDPDTPARRLALVVDDDAGNREVLQILLAQLGYQVQAVATGQAGIGAAGGAFALAFVDMRLPDVSGAEVIAAVRRAGPDTFLVVATMDDTAATQQSAYAAGCDAFLVKPYDLEQLTELVRQARRGQRWLADHLGLRRYDEGVKR